MSQIDTRLGPKNLFAKISNIKRFNKKVKNDSKNTTAELTEEEISKNYWTCSASICFNIMLVSKPSTKIVFICISYVIRYVMLLWMYASDVVVLKILVDVGAFEK